MHGLLGLLSLQDHPADPGLFAQMLREFSAGSSVPAQRQAITRRYLLAASLCRLRTTSAAPAARPPEGHTILLLDGEILSDGLNQPQQLLEAYQAEGEKLFRRLNGSFALALLEPELRRITLVCDRSASQPLFYLQTKNHFAFSSRLKPLASLLELKPRINPQALANFLACGYVLEGHSLLEGVRLLGPGQLLTIESNKASIRNYWDFSLTVGGEIRSMPEYSEELSKLLFAAVERHTRDQATSGVLLSGGYDSRVILGCMRQVQPHRSLRTITWGQEDQLAGSDAAIAGQIARHVGAQHSFYKLDAAALPRHFRSVVLLNEGRTDAVGNYPDALRIFEDISRELGVDVLFRGDECFGWKEDISREGEMLHSLSIHDLAHLPDSYEYLQEKTRRPLEEASHTQLSRLLAEAPYPGLHDKKDYLYFTQRLFGYLNPLSQLKQIVLDLRNPFLDAHILDFIGQIPTRLRLGKALFKHTAQRLFPEFESYGIAKFTSQIDWDDYLGRDAELQRYVRQVLLEQKNGFDQILERHKLEAFLDRTFAAAAQPSNAQSVAPGRGGSRSSPLRRIRRKLRRRRGFYEIQPCTEIFRLMTLKIWADEFLQGDFPLA